MTTAEIKALIANIQGQGDQVDIAGVLPAILEALAEGNEANAGVLGDLATLETDHKSNLVEAINEVFDVIETPEMVISMMQTNAERKAIYDECVKHYHIAKNIVFFNIDDGMYYRVNGYKLANGILTLHTIMSDGTALRSVKVNVASNGTISV